MKVIYIGTAKGSVNVKDIANTLECLQAHVGGYIESWTPAQLREQGITLLMDEEGVMKGLPVNDNLSPFLFVGPVLMVGVDGEEFTSLTPEQVDYCTAWLTDLTQW